MSFRIILLENWHNEKNDVKSKFGAKITQKTCRDLYFYLLLRDHR